MTQHPARRVKRTLTEQLCEHDALWFRLEHGERVDRPEDKLATYHLAFGRYLKETGRIHD